MARLAITGACLVSTVSQAQLDIPHVPLAVRQNVPPLVMLVASKEHRLFYEAYNDASDLDGDGALDIRFKPALTYLGLFNSDYCYGHNKKADNAGLFSPTALAKQPLRTCTNSWSGNWLNYVTTSRIDALRVVLYGGQREVDSEDQTILRRAYIPQDSHAWAKEYTSEAVDGYRISDYTPLTAPVSAKRHFFGNLTQNAAVNCALLTDCSNLPPLLSVVENSTLRVWDWASSESPVMGADSASHGGTKADYTVRVLVCSPGYTAACKSYGTTFKPVGLLHDYGESDQLLFGLLTGSYDKNMSGGQLRKPVGSFKNEIHPTHGRFTANAAIVNSFNSLRIRDYNNGTPNARYKGGSVSNRIPDEGDFPDWGNPMGEMIYEAIRYFAGMAGATPAFDGTPTIDGAVGLPKPAWDDPYQPGSAASAPICARANLLVVSDTNVSYDSDQVPGADPAFSSSPVTGQLRGFDASEQARAITEGEPGAAGPHFIGQSGIKLDAAPTAKEVTSLGSVRGLAPEEPTKQGSYYGAAAAYFGKRTDIRPDKAGVQNTDTFVVALASPLPRFVLPLANQRKITIIPFAKSVGGGQVEKDKGKFQPTNQIVDFYIESMANSGAADKNPAINGGRYFAQFRISYEDVEQGSDHDMDAIAQYTVSQNADDTVTVRVAPVYAAGRIKHRIGYVIAGTTADGVYLEVQDEKDDPIPYFLNTPPGAKPNHCDTTPVPGDCNLLPHYRGKGDFDTASRTFTSSTTPSATFLQDPLWYAAKWGGFTDLNGNNRPDLAAEWDADGDGVPDNYLWVQNPIKLKEALRKTLESISARLGSATSLAANSHSASSNTQVYQAVFNTRRWSGDLLALKATGGHDDGTVIWRASEALPVWNARNIFVNIPGSGVRAWKNDTSLAGSPLDIANYLAGHRDNERQRGGTLRDRQSPLGDIVHSSPVYDRDNDMVYVGANDGMLHGFRARDGQEQFAFIPGASLAGLSALASESYSHRFSVDGEIAVSERSALTSRQNFLYALLGRGGKGLFSLNVSQPSQFHPSAFLWEYTPAGSTVAREDPDLGKMLGRPLITTLAHGKLGVIVGNGYQSVSGQAVLYVFIVGATGALEQVRKINTGAGFDNGLATPALVDANHDGRTDLVYAGDLKGNVWKFDLSSTDPADWKVALNGQAFFQARDAANNPQPITAPVLVAVNDRSSDIHFGKRFIFLGTGSYFKSDDPGNKNNQSWYGLIDEESVSLGSDRSQLRQRSILETGTVEGRQVRALSAAVADDMRGKKGWYLDLDKPSVGERIVNGSQIVRLAVPALMVSTLYPVTDDPCIPGGGSYQMAVSPFTGGALETGLFDLNADGRFDTEKFNNQFIGAVDLNVGITGSLVLIRGAGRVSAAYAAGSGSAARTGTGGGLPMTGDATLAKISVSSGVSMRRRLAWREIVRD